MGTGGQSTISMVIMIAALIVIFYFFMIRPENKKKKKLQEMRDSLSVGDEITTIGGMLGKVVDVSKDTVTFETGEDRVASGHEVGHLTLGKGKRKRGIFKITASFEVFRTRANRV